MKRSIVFLLPNSANRPVGGIKVVLEYANRFVEDGFGVELVYAAYNKWYKWGISHYLYYISLFIIAKITKNYLPKWFDVDERIHQRLVWSLDKYNYPCEAKIIATAIDTVYYLNRYNIKNDNKYYFIQDYENWFVTDKFVKETYHYQMHKIVISNWLKKIVEDCGEKANLVLNGFDFRFFHLLKPISERRNKEVLCLYHTDKRKGLDVAFKAFEIVKRKYSQLHVSMFGTSREPEGLPTWYSYYQEPNKDIFNYIYNNAAIFVGSSNIEGWGLTVGEAMQCGCAVACTNNLGYLEMAKNGDTALVSPVGNAEALAENILKLIEDKELRIKIATNGNQFIKTLDIEKSYKKFKNILAVDSDGCFSDYCDV